MRSPNARTTARAAAHVTARITARTATRVAVHVAALLLFGSAVLVGCETTPEPPAESPRQRTLMPFFESEPPPAPSRIERSQLRERAIEFLEELAFSDIPLLRANAVEGLAPAQARVEPIAAAALTDENPGVRAVGAMMIATRGLERIAPQAEPLLADPDPRVRASAIAALAMNGLDVRKSAIGGMLTHPDPDVRAHAAFVLGELGEPSAVPMLREALQLETGGARQDSKRFRLQVSEALVKLGNDSAISTIRAALYPRDVEDFEMAALAAQMLGELQDDDAIAQLVRAVEYVTPDSPQGNEPRPDWYATDPDAQTYVFPPELRLAAAGSLAKMGFTDGVYVPGQYANHPSVAIRAQAAFVYGQMHPPRVTAAQRDRRALATRRALGALPDLLEDPSPMVRLHAAAGLVRLLADIDRSGASL